jgi:hypothetical protein
MRFYEYRQSATSPLRYHLELRPDELELVKERVAEIIQIISNTSEPAKIKGAKDEDSGTR